MNTEQLAQHIADTLSVMGPKGLPLVIHPVTGRITSEDGHPHFGTLKVLNVEVGTHPRVIEAWLDYAVIPDAVTGAGGARDHGGSGRYSLNVRADLGIRVVVVGGWWVIGAITNAQWGHKAVGA